MLHERFSQSVPDWPAFPDSVAALRYLKRQYKLVILSNIDNRSFAASNKKLGVAFDAVYTAEDIGSYKPNPANFAHMLERLQDDLGIAPHQVLHTAQSLFHDHVPAAAAGLKRAWINRRKGQTGSGATKPVENVPAPNFEFATLGELAEAHRALVS
jgi:2-haloacid dehalogenase